MCACVTYLIEDLIGVPQTHGRTDRQQTERERNGGGVHCSAFGRGVRLSVGRSVRRKVSAGSSTREGRRIIVFVGVDTGVCAGPQERLSAESRRDDFLVMEAR